ncbi:bifunctional riboflavin kinase/FAD synthetase [Rhabdochromatium marinum]|uniref:bifunctional riboflavin kinase/FAD synthetase n=1 Tax=Rhabdochromatium marinum TaxID=48729 RepID=UPI0019039A1B|nr:bifunctional riboflavin kinase/FAD synthetase [Rhabdochromatium marinum]MBK1647030.1 riboflavin biosynthesis protein RibF [Rhabdochromatium marinum]
MRLIRGLHNLRAGDRGCVATIGNFDGVHAGHRAVFRHLIEQGRRHRLPATVITFEPQPLEFFSPRQAPARLTRLREKARIMAEDGIEQLLVLRFDQALAALDPEAFVTRLLVEGLEVRYLLVGDDFRFGRQRAGDFEQLRQLGARFAFDVDSLATVRTDNERISSTRVRAALAAGDLDQARQLLGRPYCLHGRVAHGDQRGRTLGFPTANLRLHRHATPISGVYAVLVHGLTPQPLTGVANVGNRPTVDGLDSRLEVHLFDFDQDIYGAHIRVEFCARLRDEQKFPSLAALCEQISRDSVAARAVFEPLHS